MATTDPIPPKSQPICHCQCRACGEQRAVIFRALEQHRIDVYTVQCQISTGNALKCAVFLLILVLWLVDHFSAA